VIKKKVQNLMCQYDADMLNEQFREELHDNHEPSIAELLKMKIHIKQQHNQ